MGTTVRTVVSLQKELFDQAEIVAQHLNISRDHLFEIAIENFLKNQQSQVLLDEVDKVYEHQPNPREQTSLPCRDANLATQAGGGRVEITQGDIYWLQIDEPGRAEPGYLHPHVVIQDDILNRSRINSVVVCSLTSNIKRASEPGNVLLEIGEANLPRQSVMVVSQVSTVDKTQLGDYIGSLSKQRVEQILAGMRFQQLSFFARYHDR